MCVAVSSGMDPEPTPAVRTYQDIEACMRLCHLRMTPSRSHYVSMLCSIVSVCGINCSLFEGCSAVILGLRTVLEASIEDPSRRFPTESAFLEHESSGLYMWITEFFLEQGSD